MEIKSVCINPQKEAAISIGDIKLDGGIRGAINNKHVAFEYYWSYEKHLNF